jgi:hypothetical protein
MSTDYDSPWKEALNAYFELNRRALYFQHAARV